MFSPTKLLFTTFPASSVCARVPAPLSRILHVFPLLCFIPTREQLNAPAIVVRLHNTAQIVNIILNIIFVIGGFTNGVLTGILILLLTCIWTLLEAALIRVVAELALSVLMIPLLLAKNDPRTAGGDVGMQDLAAFGQAAV